LHYSTQCSIDSSRPWFICPAAGCGQRLAILCDGNIFACRHFQQLAYVSSREDARGRATRRAERIRACLGWEPGILNGDGSKLKWVRWPTFEQLAAKHDELVYQFIQGVMCRFEVAPALS
jgi:hypothetical protein